MEQRLDSSQNLYYSQYYFHKNCTSFFYYNLITGIIIMQAIMMNISLARNKGHVSPNLQFYRRGKKLCKIIHSYK